MGDNEFTTGKKVLGILFIIWFIGSMAGLVYAAQEGHKAVAVMILGQYFIGFDLVYLSNRKKDMMEDGASLLGVLPGIGMFVLGAALLGCGAVYTWGDDTARGMLMDNIPAIMGAGFAVAGLGLVLTAMKEAINDPTKYGEEVDAEVVSVREKISEINHNRYHVPMYRYQYNGREYIEEGGNGNIGKKGTGYRTVIKINPDNPKEVWDVTAKGGATISAVLGIACIAAGCVTIYLVKFF